MDTYKCLYNMLKGSVISASLKAHELVKKYESDVTADYVRGMDDALNKLVEQIEFLESMMIMDKVSD